MKPCLVFALLFIFVAPVLGQAIPFTTTAHRLPSVMTNKVIGLRHLTNLVTSTDGTEYVTPTFSVVSNTLILACVLTSDVTAPVAHTLTSSGLGLTWVEVTNVSFNVVAVPTERLSLQRAFCTNNATGTLTNTVSDAATGCIVEVFEVSGTRNTNNGSDAIAQVSAGSADLSTNPSITLSGMASHGLNMDFSVIGNSLSLFGGTPELNWIEDIDDGFTLPNAGIYVTHRSITVDNTVQVTALSASWGGIAVEIAVGDPYP